MAACTIDQKKKRWLIAPAHIMERSALLKLPARKWMTMQNLFVVPAIPGNARAILQMYNDNQLDIDLDLYNACQDMCKPARTERVWPTWYKFNNSVYSPMAHQVEALERLYPVNEAAALMEMGTAKTRVAIDLMTAHFYERRIAFVIVICPLTVKMGTWIDELQRFSPCPYNFIDVDSNYNAQSFRVTQDRLQWLVVGVESLSQGRTFQNLLPVTRMGYPYAVVVDESTRISNHKAICTQAAYELRELSLGDPQGVRMIMTGFEIKKSIEDLYAQFEFLNPNIIGCGDFLAFRNRYCLMGGFKNKEIIGYDNVDELMGLIAPHVFQCDKSRLKLPPKLYEKRPVKLTPEQVQAYRDVKAGKIENVSVANSLTKTLRLQQIAAGYYNTDKWEIDMRTGERVERESQCIEVVPASKNPKLREIIQVAKEISHPMIVWANSLYEVRILTEALGKLGEYFCFTGATPKDDRRAIINEFQKGNTPFFIGMQSAGGIGITLTAARTVIYFSNDQRLEARVQSEDRAHRTGQTGSVTIIDIPAMGTVDISILANHREKIDTATYMKAALRSKIASEVMEAFFSGEVDPSLVAELAQSTPHALALEGIQKKIGAETA